MHLKLPQKEQFKKQQKKPVIQLEIKTPLQNNLETNEEILRGKYISQQQTQKIIDDLRLNKD